MEDETGVQAEVTAAATQQETTEQAQDDVSTGAEEAVDEAGVPLKNRQAEAERKARKANARTTLLAPPAAAAPQLDQNEAIRLVRELARQEAQKLNEPLVVQAFLNNNPDAAEMVDDINRIRASHPELSGVDKLELAYKIARADRQDEIIRKQVEGRLQENETTVQKGNQAALEGAGKTRVVPKNLNEQINTAGSLADLQKLEALIAK